ncbi:unnamed protein product [Effrenium voratum]|uniref:Alpha/beta hydrolase fold-3 domain-containing protein n=1 Tax=Effrenium voratum TaxID=2562239 RepID=A0AA36J8M9_9DINO|nr:unnamed protein product [Effrenium voratum]
MARLADPSRTAGHASMLCPKSHPAVQVNEHLDGIEVIAKGLDNPRRALLYLHGGAHFFGSVWTHREFLGRISNAWGTRVVAINYRLSPEHAFPSSLEDTLTAWTWMLEQYPGHEVAVAGDSAGGTLAFGLLVRLAQLQRSQPQLCIGISPWLCLEQVPRIFRRISRMYAQGHAVRDPLVSPLHVDAEVAKSFPPVIIHAAEEEWFTKDAEGMASLCQRVGVAADLKLYTGMIHGFQVFPLLFPASSQDSLQRICSFWDQLAGRKSCL